MSESKLEMELKKIKKGLTRDEAESIAYSMNEQVKASYCPMCGPNANCRNYVFIKDGKIVRTAGMREAEANRGALCAKGLAAAEWQNSCDRLTTPLLRMGKRGEGKFKKISWNEALDIIADKLKTQKEKYGPESLAILSPALRDYKEISLRFLAVHGSPNHAHSGICALQNLFSFFYTIGGAPVADVANTDLVIYWGKQPAYSGPSGAPARNLTEAYKRRLKVADTDNGKQLLEQIEDLKDLKEAYQTGILKERVKKR